MGDPPRGTCGQETTFPEHLAEGTHASQILSHDGVLHSGTALHAVTKLRELNVEPAAAMREDAATIESVHPELRFRGRAPVSLTLEPIHPLGDCYARPNCRSGGDLWVEKTNHRLPARIRRQTAGSSSNDLG
jgi:hypothetical protein